MYDSLPHFYDAIHQQLTDDIAFVVALAKEQNRPILELGCGTGRLLMPLSKLGLPLVGLDNSDPMLALARERVGAMAHVGLVSADMTQFALPQQSFGLCLISYNTLTHLNLSQIKTTLTCIKRHLLADGVLVIDTLNPFMLAAVDDQPDYEPETTFVDPQTGSDMTQSARYATDHEKQTVTIEWLYEYGGGSAESQPIHAKTQHHYHYPHVLQMLLNENGYAIDSIFGDYDQTPFDEESERLIITATVA